MIPVVLTMMLISTQAQISGLVGSLTNGIINGPDVVNLTNGAKEDNFGVLGSVASGLKKEVGAVAQPVESAVVLTASSQCETLKKVLGVDYASVNLLKEQDLNQLTLEFSSPKLRVIYNITDAAELIPVACDYDPNLPLIIFAHGFTSNPEQSFTNVLESLHKKGQYNVLALDSSAYIRWYYLRSTTYVQFIGEKLGNVLAALVQRGLNPKAIHLIGHSLGAHIISFTGKQFTQLTGLRVGRISGLDPAGPCFFNVGPELKLNATDADFVDVIHTTHGTLGITEPVGHADFYPNGGTQQPDCVQQSCSHSRALDLYSESILDLQAFPAVRCTGWTQFRMNECEKQKAFMGYGSTPDTKGFFFLRTRSTPPYGLGEEGTLYKNTEGVLKSLQPLGPGALFG